MDDGGKPRLFSRLFHSGKKETAEDEIATILTEGQDQGTIKENEAEMISNIFELDDIEVSQVMTPRKNISSVDCELSVRQTLEIMCEENYSRFPVFEGNVDNIIGIIHLKDIARSYLDESTHDKSIKDVSGIIQKPVFVPETSKLDVVFKNMQSGNIHMEIVVDEYGQTCGLIAMEDILEEIVGNIFDEHDEVEFNVTDLGDGSFEVNGLTSLYELEDITGIELNDEDNDTLNGYLISRLDRIPDEDVVGAELLSDGIRFTILAVEDRIISRVRLEVQSDPGSEENED